VSTLDHIGIAVPSLDQALPLWRDHLGLELLGMEDVPSEGVRVAVFAAGSARVELLEPLGPESPVARHIEKRGPGIHHVAVRVGDLPGTLQRLRDAGCALLSEEPRPGAGGARIAFVHPRSTGGVLLEVTTGHGSRKE
jgi:methylmalonyl-CoA/ethylmalonyl-CoA epimerase